MTNVVCELSHFSCVCVTLWTVQPSLPGSSVHGDSPGKNTGVGCHSLFQGIFPTQGRTCVSYISCIGRWVLYHFANKGPYSQGYVLSSNHVQM